MAGTAPDRTVKAAVARVPEQEVIQAVVNCLTMNKIRSLDQRQNTLFAHLEAMREKISNALCLPGKSATYSVFPSLICVRVARWFWELSGGPISATQAAKARACRVETTQARNAGWRATRQAASLCRGALAGLWRDAAGIMAQCQDRINATTLLPFLP